MHTPAKGRFLEEVIVSFPAHITLPPEFVAALLWLEENDCVHANKRCGNHYATLYPASSIERGMSCVSFEAVSPSHATAWIGKGVSGADRLAPFIRTGGDGSYAGLWLAPGDRLRFVHLGSGSGSTWAGVITDDPVEMLRFLAIGYPEPCWPETFDLLPEEAYEEDDFSDEAPFAPPRLFQHWLTTSFHTTIPLRARQVVPDPSDMDDPQSIDPFMTWLRTAQGRNA